MKFIHAVGPVVKVSTRNILRWTNECLDDPDQKFRFCGHPDPNSLIHQMLIIHTDKTIIPVHRHIAKDESFCFLYGFADVVLWNDDGTEREIIPMGPIGNYHVHPYYRLDPNIYHSLRVKSPIVIFLEVTPGPWKKEDLILAPWWKPPEGWHR